MASQREVVLAVRAGQGCTTLDPWTGTTFRDFGPDVGSGVVCAVDDTHIACVQSKKRFVVQLWNWQTGLLRMKCSVADSGDRIQDLCVSPGGTFLAAGTARGLVYVWDLSQGTLLAKFLAHYQPLCKISFTSDVCFLVSSATDGAVCAWELSAVLDARQEAAGPQGGAPRTPYLEWNSHSRPVTQILSDHPSGSFKGCVITSSLDQTVKVWSIQSGRMLASLRFSSPINDIAVSQAHDELFAAAENGKIYRFAFSESDQMNGEPHEVLAGHSKAVFSLGLLAGGRLLASGGGDGTIRVFDLSTNQVIHEITKNEGEPVKAMLVVRGSFEGTQKVSNTQKKSNTRTLLPLRKYIGQGETHGGETRGFRALGEVVYPQSAVFSSSVERDTCVREDPF